MALAPSDFLDYQICGFKTLLVHYEAYPSEDDLKSAIAEMKKMGFKVGVAINPDTSVDVLKGLEIDEYLIMSVVPGKQGQSFIESSIDKIRRLREMLPNAIIEVDGGINETNIKAVKEAGADLICVGSALVKAADVLRAYELLLEQMK